MIHVKTGPRVKKIKGQVSGKLFAFLVSQSQQEKRRLSDVLRDMVYWAIQADFLLTDYSSLRPALSSSGAHCFLNLNLDEDMLRLWEVYKRKNGFTNDSMTIRFIVSVAMYEAKQAQKQEQTTFQF